MLVGLDGRARRRVGSVDAHRSASAPIVSLNSSRRSSIEEFLQAFGNERRAPLLSDFASTISQSLAERLVGQQLDQLFSELDRVVLRREERIVIFRVEGEKRRNGCDHGRQT